MKPLSPGTNVTATSAAASAENALYGYLDAEGNEADIRSWTTSSFVELPEAEWDTHFGESFPLVGYYADEVWLKPHYSHVWLAENPIVVTVQ